MIQTESVLTIVDNSGAKNAKCVYVLPGFKRRYAYIGDTIVAVIKSIKSKKKSISKVKKGELSHIVIIRTKFKKRIKDGSTLNFNINAGVLVNKQNKLLASRIIGPVTKSLKNSKHMKIASLSSGFI
jgi:large subunit ribosomal protein L14